MHKTHILFNENHPGQFIEIAIHNRGNKNIYIITTYHIRLDQFYRTIIEDYEDDYDYDYDQTWEPLSIIHVRTWQIR